MQLSLSNPVVIRFLFILAALSFCTQFVSGNFYENVDMIWGSEIAQYLDGGNVLALSLDYNTGSGFQSKQLFWWGVFSIQIKLVPNNSAGTIATFYMSSPGENHNEFDFEFLGNASGQPYTLHTNYFVDGTGDREQQFGLWFDPTANYHNYTIHWNPLQVVFMVDDIPIRVITNRSAETGIPYPYDQPMRIHCSIWDAEDWATQGGRVKTNWSEAPFTAHYRNLVTEGCIPQYAPNNDCRWSSWGAPWFTDQLDVSNVSSVQENYMTYNYCTDSKRFPKGIPPECNYS